MRRLSALFGRSDNSTVGLAPGLRKSSKLKRVRVKVHSNSIGESFKVVYSGTGMVLELVDVM